MSTEITKLSEAHKPSVMESVVMQGDLSKLTSEQRVEYMAAVCRDLRLNPLTKPFAFMTLNGKLVMYALKDCTEQLRKIHSVSISIKSRETIEGIYVVTANARLPDGREDESTGAVPIKGIAGDNLANAFMKAETKAKRRVTLSVCGLGMLDEAEVDSIPPSQKGAPMYHQPEEGDGNIDTIVYRLPFGKWKNRTLEEIYENNGSAGIESYIKFLEGSAIKKGVEVDGVALEFINNAAEFLGAMENKAIKKLDAQQRGMDADE